MAEAVELPDFDVLADTFLRLGALQSPAQLQGYLAGQLAVNSAPTAELWLLQAASYIDSVEQPSGDDSRNLLDLYSTTRAQLEAGDFEFTLLLPGEEVELDRRVESLSVWCQGFLAGFALGGKQIQQREGARQYSSDVGDALSDMAAISSAGISDDELDEQDDTLENYFFEIGEHVRMAAMTVYMECHDIAAVAAGNEIKGTLH